MTVSPGAIIASKYEIVGAPVRGGMGDVHPARRVTDNEPVALKLLRDELRDLPDALERFRREATAASRIHSEHVAQVLDVLDDPEVGLVIVFEYLEGETLEDVLKRERVMAMGQAHPLVCQILQGLADAHAVPVVHRDLKPANIFLQHGAGAGAQVKLVDFGISKVPQEMGGMVLTKAGQNLGSFSYMAPEQASAPSSVDQRADLYACGTVVFRMLTGQLPYVATSVGELIGKKSRHPARKLAEALPSAHPPFSPELEAWVGRMLERTPRARFANAWEALEAWEALASSSAKPEGKVGHPMPPQRTSAAAAPATSQARGAPRPSQPPARPAAHPAQPHAPQAPAGAGLPRNPAPRVTRAKTMLGMGPAVSTATPQAPAPPAEEPRRPPSVPTRIDRPQGASDQASAGPRPAAGRPAAATPRPGPQRPSGPGAAGPPSVPRKPPPPPKLSYDDQEPDEDESPTAMFVHPNPMAYDPNGPGEPHAEPAKAPVAAGAPPPPPRANLIDDDDYSEPPTAIHVPAYRPDEVPGAPPIPSEFRGAGAMPSPIGAPAQPQQAARARVAEPAAAAAAPHAAPAPMPAASVVQPAQFTPPGVAQPAAPVQPAPIPAPVPQQVVQAAPLEQAPSASHPSRVLPGPSMASAPGYDPDAAPLWLKALALGTVVSALTVLGVLGWMVAHRF